MANYSSFVRATEMSKELNARWSNYQKDSWLD
jgi:hypothetical protein